MWGGGYADSGTTPSYQVLGKSVKVLMESSVQTRTMRGRDLISLETTCSSAGRWTHAGAGGSRAFRHLWPRRVLKGLTRHDPCNVTNEGREMMPPDFEPSEDIDLGPQHQVPQPEKGPLGKRVGRTFIDGLFSEEISIEDMEYWFTEPPGGWDNKRKRIQRAEEIPFEWWDAKHEGLGRTRLEDLEEGMEFTGTVRRLMMTHGVQIDIGAEFDGLIPVVFSYHAWKPLRGEFGLDSQVRVRIHKKYPGTGCRFPIQLELLEPAHLIPLVVPPDEWWGPSYDFRGLSTVQEMSKVAAQDVSEGKPFDINSLLSGPNDPDAFDKLGDTRDLMLSYETHADFQDFLSGVYEDAEFEYLPPTEVDYLAASFD
eukprot:jgi/Botrbrau1/19313/Bobra.0073s0049.1